MKVWTILSIISSKHITVFPSHILATKDTELLWLENPDTHQYRSPWKQHVITHGPDVYFRNLKVNTTDGVYDVIVTTEFFAKKLSVHWTTDSMNRWNDLSKVVCTIRNTVTMIVFDKRNSLYCGGKIKCTNVQ